MTLTAELCNPRSPVSRFLSANLPGDDLYTAYQRAVRPLRTIRPPEARSQTPWAVLGTAIDLRIRVWLGEQHHPGVREGITCLRHGRSFAPRADDKHRCALNAAAAGDVLLERLAHYATAPGPLTAGQEDDAARLAILAARYDAVFRALPTGTDGATAHFTRLALPDEPAAALDVLSSGISRIHADDIRRQIAAATGPLASLKGQPLTSAPTFAGSPDVGHAEGDFIAGVTLVDVKATITPALTPSKARRWFHQLAGYLLLDYNDAHGIGAVGVYLARQATLLTWPVGDFLRLMGARIPLTALRVSLKNTLPARPVVQESIV